MTHAGSMESEMAMLGPMHGWMYGPPPLVPAAMIYPWLMGPHSDGAPQPMHEAASWSCERPAVLTAPPVVYAGVPPLVARSDAAAHSLSRHSKNRPDTTFEGVSSFTRPHSRGTLASIRGSGWDHLDDSGDDEEEELPDQYQDGESHLLGGSLATSLAQHTTHRCVINAKERTRRNQLRELYDRLQAELPREPGRENLYRTSNKKQILDSACQYIHDLEQYERELLAQKEAAMSDMKRHTVHLTIMAGSTIVYPGVIIDPYPPV